MVVNKGFKVDTTVNLTTIGSMFVVLSGMWFGLQFQEQRFIEHVSTDGHPTMVRESTRQEEQIKQILTNQDRFQDVLDRQQAQIYKLLKRYEDVGDRDN